jgi:hypothetical protein
MQADRQATHITLDMLGCQVPGKGTLRNLLLKSQITEWPEGQEQLNLQCKTGMTGCWPEGLLIKNQRQVNACNSFKLGGLNESVCSLQWNISFLPLELSHGYASVAWGLVKATFRLRPCLWTIPRQSEVQAVFHGSTQNSGVVGWQILRTRHYENVPCVKTCLLSKQVSKSVELHNVVEHIENVMEHKKTITSKHSLVLGSSWYCIYRSEDDLNHRWTMLENRIMKASVPSPCNRTWRPIGLWDS